MEATIVCPWCDGRDGRLATDGAIELNRRPAQETPMSRGQRIRSLYASKHFSRGSSLDVPGSDILWPKMAEDAS